MAHQIEDLRDHLFGTLAALRDPEKPMDIERAKAVAEVAKVIVDSAKVEVEHLKVIGGEGSGFVPSQKKLPAPGDEKPAAQPKQITGPNGGRLVQGRDTR